MKNGPYELVVAPPGYPGKLYRGRYAYEHHVVWWKRTGKTVPAGYLLHHKNEQKRDNRFRNLELKTVAVHTKEHSEARTVFVDLLCGWCSKKFRVPARKQRERLRQSLSGKLFCSKSCGALHQFSSPV